MKLALRLGKTLAELEESMTAREFYLWLAFEKLSPIGDERSDIHAAQISSSVYQSKGIEAPINKLLIKWNNTEQMPSESSAEYLFNKLASK